MSKDDDSYRSENRAAWERMPKPLRERAAQVFLEWLADGPTGEVDELRKRAKASPVWFDGSHFGMGMTIRNALRSAGLTDDMLPGTCYPGLEDHPDEWPRNWDDFYVGVMEAALGVYGEQPGMDAREDGNT